MRIIYCITFRIISYSLNIFKEYTIFIICRDTVFFFFQFYSSILTILSAKTMSPECSFGSCPPEVPWLITRSGEYFVIPKVVAAEAFVIPISVLKQQQSYSPFPLSRMSKMLLVLLLDLTVIL